VMWNLLIPRNRFLVGPVVPGVLQAVLQTFGGTERWDGWDHHDCVPRGQHRRARAGPHWSHSAVPPVHTKILRSTTGPTGPAP
jgi:hypothetical protein